MSEVQELIERGILQEKYLKGTFQGIEGLVFHGKLSTGGLLISEHEVAHFGNAYAAVRPDGTVWRNGKQIGTFVEFAVTGESTVQPGQDATDQEKELVDARSKEFVAEIIIQALLEALAAKGVNLDESNRWTGRW